jgi:hypothetical protein
MQNITVVFALFEDQHRTLSVVHETGACINLIKWRGRLWKSGSYAFIRMNLAVAHHDLPVRPVAEFAIMGDDNQGCAGVVQIFQ